VSEVEEHNFSFLYLFIIFECFHRLLFLQNEAAFCGAGSANTLPDVSPNWCDFLWCRLRTYIGVSVNFQIILHAFSRTKNKAIFLKSFFPDVYVQGPSQYSSSHLERLWATELEATGTDLRETTQKPNLISGILGRHLPCTTLSVTWVTRHALRCP
jgi:hypothetical protein